MDCRTVGLLFFFVICFNVLRVVRNQTVDGNDDGNETTITTGSPGGEDDVTTHPNANTTDTTTDTNTTTIEPPTTSASSNGENGTNTTAGHEGGGGGNGTGWNATTTTGWNQTTQVFVTAGPLLNCYNCSGDGCGNMSGNGSFCLSNNGACYIQYDTSTMTMALSCTPLDPKSGRCLSDGATVAARTSCETCCTTTACNMKNASEVQQACIQRLKSSADHGRLSVVIAALSVATHFVLSSLRSAEF